MAQTLMRPLASEHQRSLNDAGIVPAQASPEPLHGHQTPNARKSADGPSLNRKSTLDRQTLTNAASRHPDRQPAAIDRSQTAPTRHLSAVSVTSSSGKMSEHAKTGARSVATPTTLDMSHKEARVLDNVRSRITAHPKPVAENPRLRARLTWAEQVKIHMSVPLNETSSEAPSSTPSRPPVLKVPSTKSLRPVTAGNAPSSPGPKLAPPSISAAAPPDASIRPLVAHRSETSSPRAAQEPTPAPKLPGGPKHIAMEFTLSWGAGSFEVPARFMFDPNASVPMLSKVFAKQHSVPGIVRDVPIVIFDTAGIIVPGLGASHTESVILRHNAHYTMETFEIASLNDKIDAILPHSWLDRHEVIGLHSGSVYFGSAFCMQHCTIKSLHTDSAHQHPPPTKSPTPSAKLSVGKTRTVTGKKSTGLRPSAPAANPVITIAASQQSRPTLPKAYIAASRPSAAGVPLRPKTPLNTKSSGPPHRPSTPSPGTRSLSGQKRVPSGTKPPSSPLAINKPQQRSPPSQRRLLTPPKTLPVGPKTPTKASILPKTPSGGPAEKTPVRSPKSPAATSRLPRPSMNPKASPSKVPPKSDAAVLSDEPSESYDSDASSEFDENPRGMELVYGPAKRGEGDGAKGGPNGGGVDAADVSHLNV